MENPMKLLILIKIYCRVYNSREHNTLWPFNCLFLCDFRILGRQVEENICYYSCQSHFANCEHSEMDSTLRNTLYKHTNTHTDILMFACVFMHTVCVLVYLWTPPEVLNTFPARIYNNYSVITTNTHSAITHKHTYVCYHAHSHTHSLTHSLSWWSENVFAPRLKTWEFSYCSPNYASHEWRPAASQCKHSKRFGCQPNNFAKTEGWLRGGEEDGRELQVVYYVCCKSKPQ